MFNKKDERGTVVLEFAIVLPILLLVALSIIDFGRYFYVRVSLASASMEVANAVSRGLILDTDSTDIKQGKILAVVNDVSPGLARFAQLDSAAQVNLSPLPQPCPNTSNQTVASISTSFNSISPLDSFFTSASSQVTLRCLR